MTANISISFAFMRKLDTLDSARHVKFSLSQPSSRAKLLQIVPKQSAILTAYPNNGIHATHTGMTRFKSSKDAGYVRVHDQLWLWYNIVEKSQDAWKEKKDVARRQQQRLLQPATESDRGGVSYGGVVFNGPVSADRMMTGTQVTGGTANFDFR
jgi:hypothetical protein